MDEETKEAMLFLKGELEKERRLTAILIQRLDNAEKDIDKNVRRRDSIELSGSTKAPGYKVYVDMTNEKEAIGIIEAAIRLRSHAENVWNGEVQPLNKAPDGTYKPIGGA
jgi:hypothetical protein